MELCLGMGKAKAVKGYLVDSWNRVKVGAATSLECLR